MINIESIQGKTRFAVLEQLKKNKTLIQLRLLGGEYERLTVITDIRIIKNTSFFIIDYPEGFKEAVTYLDAWKFQFEFKGEDKLPYTFKTSGGQILEDGVWLEFPEIIERKQKRKHFRIDVPPGTKIHLKVGSIKREIDVINVSLGGILAVLVRLKKEDKKKAILKAGKTLKHIQLEFPSTEEERRVYIKKARVIRTEKNPQTNRYQYAIQFTGIEKDEENALTQHIYHLQREFLKKRIPT